MRDKGPEGATADPQNESSRGAEWPPGAFTLIENGMQRWNDERPPRSPDGSLERPAA